MTTPERPSWDLTGRRIEVWCLQTVASASVMEQLEAVLCGDEKARAARFRFAQHRDAFIAARGWLRVLSARYLDRPAADIAIACSPDGKPFFRDYGSVEFNVSHTEGIAVFAFARACAVGVDVEQIRPLGNMLDIAGHYFSQEEFRDLAEQPEAEQERAFFLCWTRKEAYLKATGAGIAAGLNSFRVTLKAGEPPRFLHFTQPTAGPWSLHNIEVGHGYAGAIAYGDEPRLVLQTGLLQPAALLEGRIVH